MSVTNNARCNPKASNFVPHLIVLSLHICNIIIIECCLRKNQKLSTVDRHSQTCQCSAASLPHTHSFQMNCKTLLKNGTTCHRQSVQTLSSFDCAVSETVLFISAPLLFAFDSDYAAMMRIAPTRRAYLKYEITGGRGLWMDPNGWRTTECGINSEHVLRPRHAQFRSRFGIDEVARRSRCRHAVTYFVLKAERNGRSHLLLKFFAAVFDCSWWWLCWVSGFLNYWSRKCWLFCRFWKKWCAHVKPVQVGCFRKLCV